MELILTSKVMVIGFLYISESSKDGGLVICWINLVDASV
jgi:hypothetical protein